MDEYISKQGAIDEVNRALDRKTLLYSFVRKVAICALKRLPAEDVVLMRPRGEWIPAFNGRFTSGAYWFECSKCRRIVPDVVNGVWDFCPNCGSFNGGEEHG